MEGLKNAGLPKPSVNQIELHPWQQKVEIVQYCRQNDIAVMGYSPLAKGTRFGDQMVQDIAKRFVSITVSDIDHLSKYSVDYL